MLCRIGAKKQPPKRNQRLEIFSIGKSDTSYFPHPTKWEKSFSTFRSLKSHAPSQRRRRCQSFSLPPSSFLRATIKALLLPNQEDEQEQKVKEKEKKPTFFFPKARKLVLEDEEERGFPSFSFFPWPLNDSFPFSLSFFPSSFRQSGFARDKQKTKWNFTYGK